jgi:pimeloyl-ACP methyl ester carboxylesterase
MCASRWTALTATSERDKFQEPSSRTLVGHEGASWAAIWTKPAHLSCTHFTVSCKAWGARPLYGLAGFVMDVFISYSKVQRSDAEQLARLLQSNGYTVWWDSELVSGENFTDVILAELEKAQAVIVIWSANSVKSDWVRSEANRARNRGVLIPVRTPNLAIQDIPPPFDGLHTELVTDWRAIESALNRLLHKTFLPPPRELPSEVQPIHALQGAVQAESNSDHLVVLVHGIRTHALWMSEVKPALEQAGYVVAPTSYGMYGIFRFISPFRWQRQKAIDRVVKDIRTAIRLQKQNTGTDPRRLSVIAHSFGTYVISRILTDHPEFEWYRIIFCGSVVRDDFPFDQVLDRFVSPLLNEVGTKDYWPAIAESAGWGYGSVGSNGFNRPPVETRWHHGFRHSDFLTKQFCDKFWVPFLGGGKPLAADKAINLPGLIRVITFLPIRWLSPIFLILFLLFGYTLRSDFAKAYQLHLPSWFVDGGDHRKTNCSLDLSLEEYLKCGQ